MLLRVRSLMLFGTLFAFDGCAESTTGTPVPAAAVEDKEAAEIRKALAQLPEADRKLAEEQKMCPVGKSPLGSMGVPIKVDVGGKPVFICCEGCRTALLADYEKKKAEESPAVPN